MSFAAPLWLAAAAAIAVGVVIAHFFSTSVPPRDVLPTVRFVPEGAPLAVLRTRRVSDIVLLLLRLVAVTLLGLALAGAHVPRSGPPRVVVVDVSRAVAAVAEAGDSAIAAAAGSGILIAFDSAARRVTADSLRGLATSGARGSISAGLVAAHRALLDVTDDRDAIELVLVSPVVREEIDSATARLLALWEGPVRVVRVAAAGAGPAPQWEVHAPADDPVAAVIPRSGATRNLHSASNGRATVRVVRTSPTRADSIWARESAGVLVLWPAVNARGVLLARAAADSQGGIAGPRDVVIAAFARTHQPRAGRVLVRWLDGEPAATELLFGRGCVREVAIPVDAIGDMALRESFRGIARSLLEPCGGARDFRPSVIPSEARNPQLPSPRTAELQIPRRFAPRNDGGGLPFWLAVFALGVLVAEQLLRARGRAAGGAA